MERKEITLYVCEDDRWSLAERYTDAESAKAVGDAKLSLCAAGVSAVRVVEESRDETGKVLNHTELYKVVKAGGKPPPAPKPGEFKRRASKAATGTRPVAFAPSVSRPISLPSAAPPKKPAAPQARPRKLSTGYRVALAGAAGGIAGIAGPVLLSSNVTADLLTGTANNTTLYLTVLALFLATFGVVLYATGQIGREKAKPDPADAPSDKVLVHDPTMSLEEVMSLAAIEANPFVIDFAPMPGDVEAAEPPPGDVQQIKATLLQFLGECLSSDETRKHLPQGQLDAKSRFFFRLFMLGAGQACIAALPQALTLRLSDVVEQVLTALGSEPDKARSFADGVASYQSEAKNAATIRAGDAAMSAFLENNQLDADGLARALQLWNTADRGDEAGDDGSQDVVIMFTDMVSSVETTQQIGDDGMMKLVDQHNLIVGAVLKQMRGQVVKHTGDGVMAVFPRVVDGVGAAAEIQRQIGDFNSVTQGAILKVRIGLSAGNPIRKDDDYFGTVVQTAARVCPVAGQGEIAMPDAVTKMPGCERFTYSEPIAVSLKGFSEPQLVRKLLWNGDMMAVTNTALNSAPEITGVAL